MPRAIFTDIYKDLKHKIETGVYAYQDMLPSENSLTETYQCSRNTIRRALSLLTDKGYLQPMHGKGVRIIYQHRDPAEFSIGGIESFRESAARNKLNVRTQILQFDTLVIDEKLSAKTGFAPGSEVWKIIRLRYLDEKPLILDENYFLQSFVPDLTPEIASHSIYDHIENNLRGSIALSKRRMTVEKATAFDETYIELGDYNCLAVVTSQTFDADGRQVEYTQSRHQPDYFCFYDTAMRSHR